jgi:hypothetical protein
MARINLGPTAARSRSVTVFSLLLATRRTESVQRPSSPKRKSQTRSAQRNVQSHGGFRYICDQSSFCPIEGSVLPPPP